MKAVGYSLVDFLKFAVLIVRTFGHFGRRQVAPHEIFLSDGILKELLVMLVFV